MWGAEVGSELRVWGRDDRHGKRSGRQTMLDFTEERGASIGCGQRMGLGGGRARQRTDRD